MDFVNVILISVVCGACCGILGYVNGVLDSRWQLLSMMNWGLLIVILGVSVFATLERGIEAGGAVLLLGVLAAGSTYRQEWAR